MDDGETENATGTDIIIASLVSYLITIIMVLEQIKTYNYSGTEYKCTWWSLAQYNIFFTIDPSFFLVFYP